MTRGHLLIWMLLTGSAAGAATPEQLDFFEKQVRPLFAAQCYACHSTQAKPRFAGLSLDTPAGLKRGSDTGPIIVAGRPTDSKLIQAVSGRLPVKMPPTGKLSDEQIATLVRWVEMGAPMPDDNGAPIDPPISADRVYAKYLRTFRRLRVTPTPRERDSNQ